MSTLNLAKGARIDLTKGNPGLSVFQFGLGWDERKKSSAGDADFDPDASAIVIHQSKGFENPNDLLWYNSNKASNPDGTFIQAAYGWKWADETKPYPFIHNEALKSSGDNRTGAGDGDDEVITIDVSKLDKDVSHIALIVTIFEAEARGQNFGSMNNAYCKVTALSSTTFPEQKGDLTEDYSAFTAVVMGYLYQKDGDWKYHNAMIGVNKDTPGVDGKPIGSTDVVTIAKNLTAILDIKVTA